MLQAGIINMRRLVPTARFRVVTTEPERLQRLCPGCEPVDAGSIATWRFLKVLPVFHRLAGPVKDGLRKWDDKLRFKYPALARDLIKFNARIAGHGVPGVEELWSTVEDADFLVATGGGYFTDSFVFGANGITETFRLAQKKAKPYALFGQGLGPLTDPNLLQKFGTIIRDAKVIGLREGRKGRKFLEQFGVDKTRVRVTGDDAIEMATGDGEHALLGFNIRVAEYSGVTQSLVPMLRQEMTKLAQDLSTRIVSLPIETKPQDSDVVSIEKVIPAPLLENPGFYPDQPSHVLEQIGKCRVVITGSYHAGVFALARGIPVVAVIGSEYYADKFLGLAEQFPAGVEIVVLGRDDSAQRLEECVKCFWKKAETLKGNLLACAREQIDKSHAAYKAFFAPLI